MTVADIVNSLTNNSFGSTAVTSAVTQAEVLVNSKIDDTYSAGSSNTLDMAVAITAKEILEQGRNSSKRKTSDATYTQQNFITDEVLDLIKTYNAVRGQTAILKDTTPSTSDHWTS